MTRREAREQALCLIFEGLFNNETLPDIIELAKEARELDPDPFARELAVGVFEHMQEIDAKVEKYSIGWNKARISRVVLSILRISIFEILYIDDIPVSVTINEAVELAKKYGGEGDGGFINGILGTFVRAEKADSL
jgi:N utilization substance protein B